MDQIIVGIDVAKDRLDVAVRPSGEAFPVARTAAGLDALIERLKPLTPYLVALEASGGFETVVAANLAGLGGKGGPARLGARRRTGHRPDPDR